MTIELRTAIEVRNDLAARFKARRLALNLTQEGLAERSGVSWGSLKRFERTGLMALDTVLKLAVVLDCLADFDRVCADDKRDLSTTSLDKILAPTATRRKGRIK